MHCQMFHRLIPICLLIPLILCIRIRSSTEFLSRREILHVSASATRDSPFYVVQYTLLSIRGSDFALESRRGSECKGADRKQPAERQAASRPVSLFGAKEMLPCHRIEPFPAAQRKTGQSRRKRDSEMPLQQVGPGKIAT